MVRSITAAHGGRVVSEGVRGQSASLSLFLSALIRLGSLRGKGMEWGERRQPEQRRGLKWSGFDVWDEGGGTGLVWICQQHTDRSALALKYRACHVVSLQAHTHKTHIPIC